jgi:hypothetical protein
MRALARRGFPDRHITFLVLPVSLFAYPARLLGTPCLLPLCFASLFLQRQDNAITDPC